MYNKQEQDAYLGLIDRHIEEVGKRINAVRQQISLMEAKGYEIQSQTELLTTLLEVMQSIQTIRLDTLEKLINGERRTHGSSQ